MQLVETIDPAFGPLPRPYVRLAFAGQAVSAIVDTGADASSIDELTARRLGLRYEPAGRSSGVGGEVLTFRTAPISIAILAPRSIRGRIRWTEIGTNDVALSVLRAPRRLPALVGRTDVLVHYRFVLHESDGRFELTRVMARR